MKPGIFAVTMPRIFMNDTPEDHAAIQPALSQIQFYRAVVVPFSPALTLRSLSGAQPTCPGCRRGITALQSLG